ncbi:hypothetical protein N9937_01660 [bacterium]|nr:hypothetical protein [bacterium]
MSERLKKILNMRMTGVTIFCDWEKEIDWLIEQVRTKSAPYSAENNKVLREENELLTAENRELRLRISNVKNFIDKEWME